VPGPLFPYRFGDRRGVEETAVNAESMELVGVRVKPMARPLVSFVIPVLNGENYIARCLLAIRNLQCSEGESEVLIMDNGSTDHTHEIIHNLGFDFQVVPGVHVSTLRNQGALKAQGEYVAFVDSDVELTPYWLHNGLAGFRDRKVVANGCIPDVPKDATWVQNAWDLHQRGRQIEAEPTPVSWLSSMNLIVRRDDFLAVSGFNDHLETAEDVDLCYRLGQRGTLLYNPGMKAVHWGEARDLRSFWRKEVWRGMGNLKGVRSHGLRWDELPSLGYPLYVICLVLLFGLGVFVDLWYQQVLMAPLCLLLLILPALLLALKTAHLVRRPGVTPQLFLLYLLYGGARACSVVKTCRA
jgi:glycosyltransferase involved in cell wall biosynthesis